MDTQILIGLLLTILPVSELRGGLPIIVEYATRHSISIWPYFILVLILNILVIFFIFLFLDFLHERFMNIKIYEKFMNRYLEKVRKKSERVQKKIEGFGYIALAGFVSIPIPGTGAWTGTLIAWVLGLERTNSIIAIAAGVIIAGIIILLLSLGFFNGVY